MSKRVVKLCDECRDEWELGLLCRSYLRLQRARLSFEGTIRHLRTDTPVYEIMSYYWNRLYEDEKDMLDKVYPLVVEKYPKLQEWCTHTKGLGPVAALTFVAFIRTHIHKDGRRVEINTAGKAKKYFGLFPGAELRAGQKGVFNPVAKGRVLGVIVANVLRANDAYYRALYEAKKYYYVNNSMYAEAFNDPKNCPKYEECKKKYLRKAAKTGRKPKKPTCRGHIDNMTKRWLGGILVSHATEIIRLSKGLDVSNFKAHHNYIRPKAYKDDLPDEKVLEAIRKGELITR